MVLHTWTNISISNWQFLIPCYHQNSNGNVKHILFKQVVSLELVFLTLVGDVCWDIGGVISDA